MRSPKLRTVEKYNPPYPLNKFPGDFYLKVGREIVYLLLTRSTADLEGKDWEQIFAKSIGAEWHPSSVGLDDVVFEQTAWCAKTIKAKSPSKAIRIRLISGRNSPHYSYGHRADSDVDPEKLGREVLMIWNERVAGVKRNYKHLRTVVLIKSNNLTEIAIFEFNTNQFVLDDYYWKWNKNKNLEGFEKKSNDHIFTWQPSGSQFTIIEKVPESRLSISIKRPPTLDRNAALKAINFDPSWIKIIK